MGTLDLPRGSNGPQSPHGGMRDTLFGDLTLDQWPASTDAADAFPWTGFVSARERFQNRDPEGAIQVWRGIADQPQIESRQQLQAWHFLRLAGVQPSDEVAKRVLGVVLEVALPEGLDLLAAYADHSARYYNWSGSAVLWEQGDHSLDPSIDALLAAAASIVAVIGPWDGPRPDAPPAGQARLCMLTPAGLHFGQASIATLWADPMAKSVMTLGTLLTKALIAKVPRST